MTLEDIASGQHEKCAWCRAPFVMVDGQFQRFAAPDGRYYCDVTHYDGVAICTALNAAANTASCGAIGGLDERNFHSARRNASASGKIITLFE